MAAATAAQLNDKVDKAVHFLDCSRGYEYRYLAECVAQMTEEQLDVAALNLGVRWRVPPDQQTVVEAAEVRMIVNMGDTIQLQPKTPQAVSFMNSFGRWWKIKSAHHPPAGQVSANRRPPSWFLESIPGKKQGGKGTHILQTLWILKDGDPHYNIANVCPYPMEFDYRRYPQG